MKITITFFAMLLVNIAIADSLNFNSKVATELEGKWLLIDNNGQIGYDVINVKNSNIKLYKSGVLYKQGTMAPPILDGTPPPVGVTYKASFSYKIKVDEFVRVDIPYTCEYTETIALGIDTKGFLQIKVTRKNAPCENKFGVPMGPIYLKFTKLPSNTPVSIKDMANKKKVLNIRQCISDTNRINGTANITYLASELVKVKGKVTRFSASISTLDSTSSTPSKIFFRIYEVPKNSDTTAVEKLILTSVKEIPYNYSGWVSFEFDPVYTAKEGSGLRLVLWCEGYKVGWKYTGNVTPIGVVAFQRSKSDVNHDFVFCLDYEPYKGSWVPKWYKSEGYNYLD